MATNFLCAVSHKTLFLTNTNAMLNIHCCAVQVNPAAYRSSIGVLDIFGFENFNSNR